MNALISKRTALVFVFAMGCVVGGGPAVSGQISYPDSPYAAGDVLTADGLNAKFNEIKTVVNENEPKDTIDQLSCTSGQVVKWNGTAWSCADDIDAAGTGIEINNGTVSVAPGLVGVHAASFRASNTSLACDYIVSGNALYVADGPTACGQLLAPVTLPHGVTITEFECGFVDDSTSATLDSAILYRQAIDSGTAEAVAEIVGPTSDTGYQQLLLPGLGSQVHNYGGYVIVVDINSTADFNTVTTGFQLIGCVVSYVP